MAKRHPPTAPPSTSKIKDENGDAAGCPLLTLLLDMSDENASPNRTKILTARIVQH